MVGGDMPDVLFFYYNLQTAITAGGGVPQFLDAQGADLTPYLAGDAIKDYPSLANILTTHLEKLGQGLQRQDHHAPKPLYSEGFEFLRNVSHWDTDIRKDYLSKNIDDSKRITRALTRPAEGRYAPAAADASSNAAFYASSSRPASITSTRCR
jgi:hypothetical protein